MKRSPKLRRRVLERANGCCEKCHFPAELWISAHMAEDGVTRPVAIAAICEIKGWGARRSLLEVDHRIALWLGGKDELDNLWALCPDCHVRKGDAAKIAKARRD
jgi:5-methylcytosine-specific restriction endonuclease McrA